MYFSAPSVLQFFRTQDPETIAALASLVRDPLKFNPLDFPGALVPAEDFNARWEMPGRRAAYYTRVKRSTAGAVLEVCAEMHDRAPHDSPRITILEEAARTLIEAEGPNALMNEMYMGMGISSSPEERMARDFAVPGPGYSRIVQRGKLEDSEFTLFSWVHLVHEFPADAEGQTALQLLYRFPLCQYIERVLIACTGMQSWNSAPGGVGGPNHLVLTPEMQTILAKVRDSLLHSYNHNLIGHP